MILITNLVSVTRRDTQAKASRQAQRLLHRGVVQWATILDPATGAVRARYVRRDDGRVERAE